MFSFTEISVQVCEYIFVITSIEKFNVIEFLNCTIKKRIDVVFFGQLMELYRIIDYLLDFLPRVNSEFFSEKQYRDVVSLYKAQRKQIKDENSNIVYPVFGQMPLDPRWEHDSDQSDQFFFNHTKTVKDEAYWQRYNTRIQSSTCTVQQMIDTLQRLNTNLPINTDLLAFRNSPSLVYANNQKQRRLRRLRHEIDITRRMNQYKQRLYNQKLFLYGDSYHNVDLKNVEPKRYEKIHLIRDIDDIQEMYDEACLDALQVEQEQRMLLQKTKDDQKKETQVLTRLIRQYLIAPIIKDEEYREINKQVFQDYDDDPFQMAVHEIDERDGQQSDHDYKTFEQYDRTVRSKYPKLKVYSKRTEQDREKRRTLLLSSPFSNIVKGMEKEAWDMEVDRVSGMLATIMPSSTTINDRTFAGF